MLTPFCVASLALALVLLVALHRRLFALPGRVWLLARKEREAEAPKALDAMKEAVASKVGASVTAIRQYEEGIAARFRAQIADAEMRARIGERRAEETHAALQASLSLVRELRAALDGFCDPPASRIATAEDEPDDERTRVAERPADLTSLLRPCIPPPSTGEESRSGGGRGAS